jgi:pimeloyl-ACP methyl ester carboxylesterase
MKRFLTSALLVTVTLAVKSQLLPGFRQSGLFDEQQMVIEAPSAGTRVLINAPLTGFGKGDRVLLVFYALPNGNSIEQTFGKKMKEGDDWHFDIQHIGAQTRYLRRVIDNRTIVVAYLENNARSWPAWTANTPGAPEKVRLLINEITALFDQWNPELVLNGHSGGGRFIFNYLEAFEKIPDRIVRIAFLDSNYGWENNSYGPKIVSWLRSGKNRHICTLAYNDSVVIYNGKPLVSPTGGTWYRTGVMKNYFADSFRLKRREQDSLVWYSSSDRRIEFVFKPNPEGKILHTRQVEYNGFIHSMLSGTLNEQKGYRYYGARIYSDFISDTLIIPVRRLNIPGRDPAAESGSLFMKRISTLPRDEREEEIFQAAASGNIPGFLREMVTLKGVFHDFAGVAHTLEYEAMPDYLAIGSDDDFCRIPMTPHTAQRLADLFGGSMLTAKLSDHLWENAEVKLVPFNYVPVGNANELVEKFVDHNSQIEKQLTEASGRHGQLVAGIKKDVIISSKIAERPDRVVIYGWHKTDGKPIQPVYSGHIWWYVDYSHGIRFMNAQVLIDGRPVLLPDLLRDPVLFRVITDEEIPVVVARYPTEEKK